MNYGNEQGTPRTAATPEYLYTDFRPGQRVLSCEGFPGVVTEILDGPGNNTIIVRLDNGMGGGQYGEQELTALNTTSASGEHTADQDYPELGSILTERPDLKASMSEDEYLGRKSAILKGANDLIERMINPFDPTSDMDVTAAMVHCDTCDVDYAIDSMDEVHDHSKTAEWDLHLPLDSGVSPNGAPGEERSQGFTDGYNQAQSGATREPKSADAAYRADFAKGWSEGITNRPPEVEVPKTDSSDMGTDQDASPKMTAGIVDFLKGNGTPSKTWAGPGHNWSFDWCRFRKNSRCMYPKELNTAASDLAGYAVWIPEDRGYCPRISWEDQKTCPVSEPGPHAPGGLTDATVPWEQGGQHGGTPGPDYVRPVAAKVEASADTFGFAFTSTWNDVRAKAKAIRAAGGVRVLSSVKDTLVAQVLGDNHVYQCEVSTVPGGSAVSHWTCACPWGAYSWGRTGPWKKYEGRMCAHALATVYEAQSRGMFGKDIKEDQIAPAWMPRGADVKLDGDWSRDKGRWASLTSLTSPDSAWDLVALMLSTGAAVVEVHQALLEMGVSQHVASRGRLRGKVNGQVKDLIFLDGDVLDGDQPISGMILYPSYDPHAGLNFTPSVAAKKPAKKSGLSRESVLRILIASGTDIAAAARAMITLAKKAEPTTTSFMQSLAHHHSGHLEGLEWKIKSEDSLVRKMTSEIGEFGGDAGKCAINMSDSLRYTMIANPDNYVRTVKDCLADLTSGGYLTRVKNYWQRGDPYQGINVAVMTPSGHPFELQFHTPESFRIKNVDLHPLYERFRVCELEKERKALYDKMVKKNNKVEVPGGVELIEHLKFQNYTPLSEKAASMGTYRYLMLHTLISGHPTTVMREYIGDDDYRTEVWRDGAWVMDNEYARHTLLGDVRTEEITEAEANALIASTDKEGALDDEFAPLLAMATAADTAEASPRVEGTKMSTDEWGLWSTASDVPEEVPLAPYEEYAKFYGDHPLKESVKEDHWGIGASADMHETPEAALPTTDGAEDDDVRAKATAAVMAALAAVDDPQPTVWPNPLTCYYCHNELTLEETDDGWGIYRDSGGDARCPENDDGPHECLGTTSSLKSASAAPAAKDPHAWLMEGNGSSGDVAAMAQQFLANKVGTKNFSAGERAQLIGEGEGTIAGNLGSLDLSGTHYQALDAMTTVTDDEIGFF